MNIFLILIMFAFLYILIDFNDEVNDDNTTSKFAYNSVPNKTKFQKIFNKLYLSVSTMTTLGFGDIYPIHPLSQTLIALQTFSIFIAITEFVKL